MSQIPFLDILILRSHTNKLKFDKRKVSLRKWLKVMDMQEI